MEIALPPEIEKALKEQARQQGTTPEQLALETLRRQFVSAASPRAEHSQDERSKPVEKQVKGNLADFLFGFIGVLHSSDFAPGGAKLSESTAGKFAAALAEKRKQGRL
jgi:hypothetical protein